MALLPLRILNKIILLWLLICGAFSILITYFSINEENETLVSEEKNVLNGNNQQSRELRESHSHCIEIEMLPSSSNLSPKMTKISSKWRVASTALIFQNTLVSLAQETKTRKKQMQQNGSWKRKIVLLYSSAVSQKIACIDYLIVLLGTVYILWYNITKFGLKHGWQEGGTIIVVIFLLAPLLPILLNYPVRNYLKRASNFSKFPHFVRNRQLSLAEQKISQKIKTIIPLKDRLHKLESLAEMFSLGVAAVLFIVMLARYFSGHSRNYEDDLPEFQAGRAYNRDIMYFICKIMIAAHFAAFCMDLDCISWVFQISLAHSIKEMITQKVLILEPQSLERMGCVNTLVTDCLNTPLGLKEALDECFNAGVKLKVLTEDHCITADIPATYCGILNGSSQDQVVDAMEFKSFSQEERLEKIDDILVMTGCSSTDKLLFVECLKQKGQSHVISAAMACEGDQIAEILKTVDVGVLLVKGQNQSIQVLLQKVDNIDIIIMDDNFSSIAKAFTWGRLVHANTQKLILFQLIASLNSLFKFIYIDAFNYGTPQIERLMMILLEMIWVNYGLGMLAAITLGNQRPCKEALVKAQSPLYPIKPLITNKMWVQIVVHSTYQFAVIGIFWYGVIFKVNPKNDTMIFVFTIFCQVCNLFNARKPEKKIVFKGIKKDLLFLGVAMVIIVIYVFIMLVLRNIVGLDKLDGQQWMVCCLLGSTSLLIDLTAKCLPITEKQPSLPFCC